MGNKQSSSSNSSSTTTVLDQSIVNNFNKSLFDTSIDVLVKNASSCSSSVNANNDCNFSNLTAAGPVNIGGNQSNDATVSFSCVQANDAQSSMATAMMSKALSEMQTAAKIGLEAQLASKADSSTNTGAGSTAIANTSNTKSSNNNTVSITNQNIQNIYEQKLKTNFTTDTVSECIGKTTVSNSLSASGITSGSNINANCVQSNTVKQVSECKQLNKAITDTTNQVLQEVGIAVAAESTTQSATAAKSESSNTVVSTGPIQDLFTGISGVFTAASSSYIYCVACCCIVLILVLVGGAVFMQMKGGKGGKMSGKMGMAMNMMGGGIDILSSISSSSILSSDVTSLL